MRIRRAASGIPSWWLAVLGAFLVGVSATLGPILIWRIDEGIQMNLEEIDKQEEHVQRLWNASVGSDRRIVNAGVLLGLAKQVDEPTREFLIMLASEDAAAILSDSTSILDINANSCHEGTVDSDKMVKIMRRMKVDAPTCQAWFEELKEGRLEAFRSMASVRTGMLGASSVLMKDSFNSIRLLKTSVRNSKQQIRSVQYLVMFFSLAGLLLVLFKDIPIWKDSIARVREPGP